MSKLTDKLRKNADKLGLSKEALRLSGPGPQERIRNSSLRPALNTVMEVSDDPIIGSWASEAAHRLKLKKAAPGAVKGKAKGVVGTGLAGAAASAKAMAAAPMGAGVTIGSGILGGLGLGYLGDYMFSNAASKGHPQGQQPRRSAYGELKDYQLNKRLNLRERERMLRETPQAYNTALRNISALRGYHNYLSQIPGNLDPGGLTLAPEAKARYDTYASRLRAKPQDVAAPKPKPFLPSLLVEE